MRSPAVLGCPQVRGVLACEIGIATSSRDKTIKLWVEESKTKYVEMTAMVRHCRGERWHGQGPCAPAISPCSGSPHAPTLPHAPLSQVGHTDYVGPLAFIPAGLVAELPHGAIVSGVWSVAWRPRCPLQPSTSAHSQPQPSLSPPTLLLTHPLPPSFLLGSSSGSRDATVRIWDPTTGEALSVCKGHTYQVSAVGLMPTGEVVSASLDK